MHDCCVVEGSGGEAIEGQLTAGDHGSQPITACADTAWGCRRGAPALPPADACQSYGAGLGPRDAPLSFRLGDTGVLDCREIHECVRFCPFMGCFRKRMESQAETSYGSGMSHRSSNIAARSSKFNRSSASKLKFELAALRGRNNKGVIETTWVLVARVILDHRGAVYRLPQS